MSQFETLKAAIEPKAKLIAISKTRTNDEIQALYNKGHRAFGENKVQEIEQKFQALPQDIEWHFVGHLQSNKVKYIAPFVHLIHAVESRKLLSVINKEAIKNNRKINVLFQVKIADEDTKFGMSFDETQALTQEYINGAFPETQLCGLMGMATNTDDTEKNRAEFQRLNQVFETLKNEYFANDTAFSERSMGMSSDYEVALECGSTMVRIGTAIFGPRNYNL